ncbi:hypothetical protein EAG_02467 [Camponotus floridanus]|uniref:Uncharacterized protein n=1 Tax=Camponotus floridanus TaxID=104421 RepID=E2AIJ9_CAMFO|nr:hypothetical protein EAG_02467 [Camponotus floridanus]
MFCTDKSKVRLKKSNLKISYNFKYILYIFCSQKGILIGDDVYCTSKLYKTAEASNSATKAVRCLLEGLYWTHFFSVLCLVFCQDARVAKPMQTQVLLKNF